ncbi:MAG: ribonuclease HI [Candidatus Nomurabacteria bacterium]|jgi:ribonuclease HI|nr:ribonuclease HI [Candidatus Nomurabacteria bacterium]
MAGVTIYFTDGSASPNPGPGGWAVIKDSMPYLIGGEYDLSFGDEDFGADSGGKNSGATDLENSAEQAELFQAKPDPTKTTNIRMEAFALLNALDDAAGENCEIHSDSQFWIDVLTKWAPAWAKNGWRKKGGIKNLDLVKKLFAAYRNSRAKLVWVRGHVGTELNELADKWANEARRRGLTRPTRVDDLPK